MDPIRRAYIGSCKDPTPVDCNLVKSRPGKRVNKDQCAEAEDLCFIDGKKLPRALKELGVVPKVDTSRVARGQRFDAAEKNMLRAIGASKAVAQAGAAVGAPALKKVGEVLAQSGRLTADLAPKVASSAAQLADTSARKAAKIAALSAKKGIAASKQTASFLSRKGKEAGKTWWKEFWRLYDVDSDLPPDDHKCWKNAKETTKAFQNYLALKFAVSAQQSAPDADFCRGKPPKCNPVAVEARTSKVSCPATISPIRELMPYQLAMIAPILRVKQLLIVAGTGTGKSQMYLSAVASLDGIRMAIHDQKSADAKRCYVICPDDIKAYDQFSKEMCKNPDWESVRGRMHEYVSVGTTAGEKKKRLGKVVNFIKYTTAGIIASKSGANATGTGNIGKCEFDDQIVVMDEVHTLVTLQDIAPNQIQGILALAQWLRVRHYHKYIALTATLPTDLRKLTSVLNYFMPENEQLEVEEKVEKLRPGTTIQGLVVQKTELDRFANWISLDDVRCRVKPRRSLDPTFASRIEGINLCMYSSDRDGACFPVFDFKEPKVVSFSVPGLEPTPSKSPKLYEDRLPTFHKRFKKIATAWAPVLCSGVEGVFSGLNKSRKTLIFMSQHDAVTTELHRLIEKRNPDLKPLLLVKSLKDTRAGQKQIDAILDGFNCSERGGCLVANTLFATGITFWGVVELHQIVPASAELDFQLAGRVRRFCSHGALPPNEWKVKHYVWSPSSKGTAERPCEQILADYVASEKAVLSSLLGVLWDVSYTKKCFYRNPPDVVKNTESYESAQRSWAKEWNDWSAKVGKAAFYSSLKAFTPTWRPHAKTIPVVGKLF